MLAGEASINYNDDMCLSCGRCLKNCPISIDIPAMVNKLRLQRHEKLRQRHISQAYDFILAHIAWIKSAIKLEASVLLAKLLGQDEN
jgi:L-lactate utilization protein LutB